MPSNNNLPFGLTSSQAEGILRLCASPDWPAYAAYLRGFGSTSAQFLRKRNQSPEDHGFFKGQIQAIEDQLSFPFELAKKMRGERQVDEPDALE
jgi:hypothetical protein